MTVSSPVNSVTYTGNNATTIFSYAFEIRVAENAVVVLTDITDPDNPSAVTLAPSQFTLSGVGEQAGGTVTYPLSGPPIDTDTRITIQSVEEFTQEIDLVNQDGFYPSVVEVALDKLTRLCQQLDEEMSRAVLIPVGSTQDVDLSSLIESINAAAALLSSATSVLTPCTATGTNVQLLSPVTGVLTSYVDQALFSFVAAGTSTAAVTANISSLGAKKVYLENGVQASTDNISSGVFYLLSYVAALDGAVGGFYIIGSGAGIELSSLPDQAQSTFLGRAAGAGTGAPSALTATQATAILNNAVGDAGAGGTKGLVPAPAAGDTAAGKFLKADATWAAPPAAGGFPAGTLMLFQQTAAPTGWTKQTTHHDKALRLTSGTASSGGSVAFSTVFAQTVVGGTAISIAQMPAHDHPGSTTTAESNDGTGTVVDNGAGFTATTPASFSAGAVTVAAQGGGATHSHPMDIRTHYVDVIIASKDA